MTKLSKLAVPIAATAGGSGITMLAILSRYKIPLVSSFTTCVVPAAIAGGVVMAVVNESKQLAELRPLRRRLIAGTIGLGTMAITSVGLMTAVDLFNQVMRR